MGSLANGGLNLGGGGSGGAVVIGNYDSATKTLTGKAPAGFTVALSVAGAFVANVVTNSQGVWSYTFANSPADGASITAPQVAAYSVPAAPVSNVAPKLTRSADGSVGQTYTSDVAGQWLSRTPAGVVSEIAGQTGKTYVAVAGDVNNTIGQRAANGLSTFAFGPVLGAVLLLDAMDATTGHSALGSGTVLSLRTDVKVQGAGALQADGPAATANSGVDFTGSDVIDPSTLGVIVCSVQRLTEGVITGHQIFVHAGTPNGNVLIQNDQLQLSGQKFVAFNSSEISAIQGQPASTIRTRIGMLKGTSTAASSVFDAMMARAGGKPIVLLSGDDGYKTQRTVIHGELVNRGFKATFFPAPGLIMAGGTGEFEWMTPADVKFLYDYGHDIGCDGTMDDTAMSATPADAVTALNNVRAWVEANAGTRASRFFCYPFGNHQNEAVAQALMDAGYLVGRGTQLPGNAHTRFGVPLAVRKKFPSTGIAKTSVASTLLAKLDEAISRGLTASFHFHSFSEDAGGTGNAVLVPSSVYTPFLDGLAQRRDANLCDVLTYSEWAARDFPSSLPV